jgi:hypothetical protein
MKLTLKEALEILQAMDQLDGYHNGSDKLTFYKYPGDVRLKIAIAKRKLRAIQEDFAETRNGLLEKVTGPEFTKTMNEMLKGVVEVDIEPLPVDKFNLDENPIPPSVLDMLGSFIQ